MDEAAPRILDALSGLQGFTPGAVMTEAKRLARNAVKAQWRAQGRKVPWVDPRDLAEAASAYLDTHQAELINQAIENLRQQSVRFLPQLRTLAARTERECGGNRR
jgi:short-subunit dehydrogenase